MEKPRRTARLHAKTGIPHSTDHGSRDIRRLRDWLRGGGGHARGPTGRARCSGRADRSGRIPRPDEAAHAPLALRSNAAPGDPQRHYRPRTRAGRILGRRDLGEPRPRAGRPHDALERGRATLLGGRLPRVVGQRHRGGLAAQLPRVGTLLRPSRRADGRLRHPREPRSAARRTLHSAVAAALLGEDHRARRQEAGYARDPGAESAGHTRRPRARAVPLLRPLHGGVRRVGDLQHGRARFAARAADGPPHRALRLDGARAAHRPRRPGALGGDLRP